MWRSIKFIRKLWKRCQAGRVLNRLWDANHPRHERFEIKLRNWTLQIKSHYDGDGTFAAAFRLELNMKIPSVFLSLIRSTNRLLLLLWCNDMRIKTRANTFLLHFPSKLTQSIMLKVRWNVCGQLSKSSEHSSVYLMCKPKAKASILNPRLLFLGNISISFESSILC